MRELERALNRSSQASMQKLQPRTANHSKLSLAKGEEDLGLLSSKRSARRSRSALGGSASSKSRLSKKKLTIKRANIDFQTDSKRSRNGNEKENK
tara:strand:- start:550 stop:834 length:285 start_codon:yes stop_codon:yes gene_type:complete